MMLPSINIYVISGDDYLVVGEGDLRFQLPITKAGVAQDITDNEFTFMVKGRRTDLDDDALITKTVGNGLTIADPQTGDTKGVLYLALEADDTAALGGRYPYELQSIGAAGVVTLLRGLFYVEADLITTGAGS